MSTFPTRGQALTRLSLVPERIIHFFRLTLRQMRSHSQAARTRAMEHQPSVHRLAERKQAVISQHPYLSSE